MTSYPHFGPHMPCFLAFEGPITEDRLERTIEKLCNAADAAYMAGKATTEQYEGWYEALSDWSGDILAKHS
jgi:hypothetical protein